MLCLEYMVKQTMKRQKKKDNLSKCCLIQMFMTKYGILAQCLGQTFIIIFFKKVLVPEGCSGDILWGTNVFGVQKKKETFGKL